MSYSECINVNNDDVLDSLRVNIILTETLMLIACIEYLFKFITHFNQ